MAVFGGEDGRGKIGRIAIDDGRIAHRRLIDHGDAGNEAVFDFDVNRNAILKNDAARVSGSMVRHGHLHESGGKQP